LSFLFSPRAFSPFSASMATPSSGLQPKPVRSKWCVPFTITPSHHTLSLSPPLSLLSRPP
jgi:hypothetical protein